MDIDKKTNTVLLGCVTSFLEEFFPQYTALILETRKHHFKTSLELGELIVPAGDLCGSCARVEAWLPGSFQPPERSARLMNVITTQSDGQTAVRTKAPRLSKDPQDALL